MIRAFGRGLGEERLLRGWLFAVRRAGWLRSARHWPKWLSLLARKLTPRHADLSGGLSMAAGPTRCELQRREPTHEGRLRSSSGGWNGETRHCRQGGPAISLELPGVRHGDTRMNQVNITSDGVARSVLESRLPSARWRLSDLWRAPLTDLPVRDELIRQYVPRSPRMKILEVGPGSGFPAFRMAREVGSIDADGSCRRQRRHPQRRFAAHSQRRSCGRRRVQ